MSFQGLADVGGSDLEAVHKYLDSAGSKLDYRTYGEILFDIIIAGGILGEVFSEWNTLSSLINSVGRTNNQLLKLVATVFISL